MIDYLKSLFNSLFSDEDKQEQTKIKLEWSKPDYSKFSDEDLDIVLKEYSVYKSKSKNSQGRLIYPNWDRLTYMLNINLDKHKSSTSYQRLVKKHYKG